MELINAKKLLETLAKRREYIKDRAKPTATFIPVYKGQLIEIDNIAQIVENMVITPVDMVKHGYWIEKNYRHKKHNLQCSVCEKYIGSKGHARSYYTQKKYKFCYHCGAKMDKVENE